MHGNMKNRYHTLFEDMNVGVDPDTGDPRGRFVWGNTALLQILGTDQWEDLPGDQRDRCLLRTGRANAACSMSCAGTDSSKTGCFPLKRYR